MESTQFMGFLHGLQERNAAREEELKATLGEWQTALQRLMGQISSYLQEFPRETIRVEERTTIVREEILGEYEARALSIHVSGGPRVDVEPKARHVVAARGRVDFICQPRSMILARFNDQDWSFMWRVNENSDWHSMPFTKDSLLQVLESLMRSASPGQIKV